MVILSNRKSKKEKEIIKILKKYGANYISDKILTETNGIFTIASIYKKTELDFKKGIAVFTEKTLRFKDQKFPIGIVGLCEEDNFLCLETFKKNRNAVITCGANHKNTFTLSSNSNGPLLVTLQRSFYNIEGNIVEPCELKITLTEDFSPFSVMCATVILLYHGILPDTFWIKIKNLPKISLQEWYYGKSFK